MWMTNYNSETGTYSQAYRLPCKRQLNEGEVRIEIPDKPSEMHVEGKDEKGNFKWVINEKLWREKSLFPDIEKKKKKVHDLLNQYRNETDMLKEGIITERAVTDVQYKKALAYLQQLKDITDTATPEKPELPEEPKELE